MNSESALAVEIEVAADLFFYFFGIFRNLLPRKHLPHLGFAARITDHTRTVPNNCHRTMAFSLQMRQRHQGDDQWGNILAGVDLIRRVEGAEAECITWPLITTSGGEKMGKTASGAVWLDASRTSPYDFYQYWINTDDRDVKRFLLYFTFLPINEIEELGRHEGADIRQAKEVLAFEATKITHGEDEAEKARDASQSAFQGKTDDDSTIPSTRMEVHRFKKGISVVDALAETGLARSKGAARRLIQQGGAYVNQARVENIDAVIYDKDLQNHAVMIRAGKKKYHKILAES